MKKSVGLVVLVFVAKTLAQPRVVCAKHQLVHAFDASVRDEDRWICVKSDL